MTPIYFATISCESENCYIVRFPDIPEALTSGTTWDEALSNASDCLLTALKGRIRDKEKIPFASENIEGGILVHVDLQS